MFRESKEEFPGSAEGTVRFGRETLCALERWRSFMRTLCWWAQRSPRFGCWKNGTDNKLRMKKVLGLFLVIVGTLILLTPFTPGSILLVIGLDILFGDRVKWWVRIKKRILRFLRPWRGYIHSTQKKIKLLRGELQSFTSRGRKRGTCLSADCRC